MEYLPYQQRVVEEADALTQKFDALEAFLTTKQYSELSEIEKNHLFMQKTFMYGYLSVLEQRIDNFEVSE